jgi:hypothetical protein
LETFSVLAAGFGSIVEKYATVVLFLVAILQLYSFKKENLKSRTLTACDRYDLDPILDMSIREIAAANRLVPPAADRKVLHTSAATICNYLDSIAVGIEQGLYIESLVKDHLQSIVVKHVDDYLKDSETAATVGLRRSDYDSLTRLATKWESRAVGYKDGWLSALIRRRK